MKGNSKMRTYEGKTSAKIYRQQLKDLVENPDHVITVRGRPTREMLNVMTVIEDPRARCQIVPGRRLNPWLALSESLWLLAGRNDVASLLPYNKRITEFSDDGVTLYGAYGARMYDQIVPALSRFMLSDTDRRVVLQIWDKEDMVKKTKDPPCNQQVMLKIRNEKLFMTIPNRSNDLHWGLHAVNLFQFGMFQEYMACRLGVGMGTQTHYSDSLHIYTDKKAQRITDRMMKAYYEEIEEISSEGWLFPNPWPRGLEHKDFALLCGAVLDGNYGKSLPEFPFLEFAEDFLRAYRDGFKPDEIRYQTQFSGWMKMGIEYLVGLKSPA